MEKTQLEIGDKLQRFEVQLTKEVEHIYEIVSVTKTLAKTKDGVTFLRVLNYDTTKPSNSTNKIIAEVDKKGTPSWSTPRYYLIEEINSDDK